MKSNAMKLSSKINLSSKMKLKMYLCIFLVFTLNGCIEHYYDFLASGEQKYSDYSFTTNKGYHTEYVNVRVCHKDRCASCNYLDSTLKITPYFHKKGDINDESPTVYTQVVDEDYWIASNGNTVNVEIDSVKSKIDRTVYEIIPN